MKRLLVLALLTATSALAQPHPLNFNDLISFHRIGGPQLSSDGNWIAYDAATPDLAANASRSAIFLMPAGGGAAKQITEGKKQDSSPAWSPDGKTIAFVSNSDGGESQVYLYDVAVGTSKKVTDLAGGAGSLKWLPDGSGFVIVSDIYPDCGVDPQCVKEKTAAASQPSKGRVITSLLYRHWKAWQEPTRSHILYVPLSGAARDLTPGPFDAPPFSVGGGDEFDVSPDGKELVFARNTDAHPEISTNADLFLVPVTPPAGTAAGSSIVEPKRITTRTGADTSPKYSPDGRWIAYRSQARAGYESDLWELWLYDRASGQSKRLIPGFPDWVDSITWAPDSKSILITAPHAAGSSIYEVSLAAGAQPRVLWERGSAGGVTLSPDGKTVYFEASTLSRPTDIYSMARGGGETARLTHDNDALLTNTALAEASDFWWLSADGIKIQGLVVKPVGFDASRKYPLVVLIHGGPQGHWGDAWSYRWNPQMYAARGYMVLMPNPRGSTGYGQPFVEGVSQDWGGRAYDDIMRGVDAFAKTPNVDASRMGAAGASYGGYMVDWILGHTDRFKVLVSHDGVYDIESMYGATEELWFVEWEMHGTPWDNPELYEKWSPHKFVKNFKTPTLVVQGELDFRVPVNQGLELFTALQRRDIPSKLLYFPDEGHWVLKPQNSKLWHQTVLDWLDHYLK
jgi:dipeptidyl aminopeptidase/acylaminoacyl peptidase